MDIQLSTSVYLAISWYLNWHILYWVLNASCGSFQLMRKYIINPLHRVVLDVNYYDTSEKYPELNDKTIPTNNVMEKLSSD